MTANFTRICSHFVGQFFLYPSWLSLYYISPYMLLPLSIKNATTDFHQPAIMTFTAGVYEGIWSQRNYTRYKLSHKPLDLKNGVIVSILSNITKYQVSHRLSVFYQEFWHWRFLPVIVCFFRYMIHSFPFDLKSLGLYKKPNKYIRSIQHELSPAIAYMGWN